jgi:hypothetical protein
MEHRSVVFGGLCRAAGRLRRPERPDPMPDAAVCGSCTQTAALKRLAAPARAHHTRKFNIRFSPAIPASRVSQIGWTGDFCRIADVFHRRQTSAAGGWNRITHEHA